MDIPDTAFTALADAFEDGVSVVMHSWTTEGGVIHAVVATSPEGAFDEGEDAFDVDRVEISMVTLRHEVGDETWTVDIDSGIGLEELFGELVEAYYMEESEDADAD